MMFKLIILVFSLVGLINVCVGQIVQEGQCDGLALDENFDISEFLGKWFEIARTSNPNQEGDCAAFDFTSGNNGIDVQYTAVRSNFFEEATGMMTQEGDTAKFKMTISSFEEPVDFWVLELFEPMFAVTYSCQNISPTHRKVCASRARYDQTTNMDFTDKVVLITGASAGIGESTALLFAKLGAKLSLVGRNQANLQAVADECEKQKGLKPLAIVADLGTDEGVEKTAKDTLDHFGRLDVLVNNAAVGARTTIQLANMETFDRVFSVNIRGVYNLTRLLVPALIESKGNIVNVSSIMATMVTTGNLPYSLSKAALDHFSRLIAYELAPKGVRVNVVSPGITVSTFVQRLTGYSDEEYRAWLKTAEATIPMGTATTGDDCAYMIAHLACDKLSRVVSGAVVPVDGALQFAGSGNSEILKEQIK